MSKSEIFNERRMKRCAAIVRLIMNNWQRTNAFHYTVRATDSVEGISLDQLRNRYFTVGVGDSLTDIPFHDMLVVFSMIKQQCAALRKRPDKSAKQFTIQFTISTEFSDDDAALLLSEIVIETPFDKGERLRVTPVLRPSDESEDED